MAITRMRPFTEVDIGRTVLTPTYRVDLRPLHATRFVASSLPAFRDLSWSAIGRPHRVERWSSERNRWEREHDESLPVRTSWQMFNRSFQKWFDTDTRQARYAALRTLATAFTHFDYARVRAALEEITLVTGWDYAHRVEDAIWDPRSKRDLFAGLEVERPRILVLGAGNGYEAMQLLAMYPGGHAVLVDYDDYCCTHRFGQFPEAYPFLGTDPATGSAKIWYRDQMNIDFEVTDIADLRYGREFDIILSVGLVEHFPDEHKPRAFELHRRFLKPGGLAILTTPLLCFQTKLYYTLFADSLNYVYRELMAPPHLGLYAWENGFEPLRLGRIRAHNALIARSR